MRHVFASISNGAVDPIPVVFLNADPDPALKNCIKLPYEEFSGVEKDKKDSSKVKKKQGAP